MHDVNIPSFAEAVARMEVFLRESGKPFKIEWVFYEDATGYKRKLWIRLPIPAANEDLARAMYENGAERGFGVQINAFRSSGDTSYCYVWSPADETDAEYALISGLKLSWRDPLLPALEVHSRFSWHIRNTINKLRGWPGDVSQLPKKKETHNKCVHQTGFARR